MRGRPLILLAALVALAACNSGSEVTGGSSVDATGGGSGSVPDTTGPSTDSSTPGPTGDATIDWRATDDPAVETGSLEVLVDPDDPSKGSFQLYVARHLAPEASRIGSLLVNPGGPGFGGTDLAVFADQIYSEQLLESFDIVAWDPRGTGLSEPALDCIDDYDAYYTGYDITPDDDAERQQIIDLAQEFTERCVDQNADILQYVGTNASARDMDSLRRALGEDRISYFGFSYGSELGAAWATLFPDTVRAAVLDGAADPNADFVESGLQQSAGFELALTNFLADCSGDPTCAFHHDGDAETAFDALMLELDENPIPTTSDRPDLTRGMAITATAQAMYSEQLWPVLADGLAAAEQGDGEPLLGLFDQYYARQPDGTWDNSLEAFQVISCMDMPERLTVEEDDATAAEFIAIAPRFSPGTTGSYFCTFFPPTDDPAVKVTGAGAGTILVMGTTGDPATPLESSRAMAAALEDGRLVIVDAEGHTGYLPGSCSGDVIDAYLLDPVGAAPVDGTECN